MTREEAIEVMREKLPWLTHDTKRLVMTLVPELAESEDERILASIADCVGLMGEDGNVFSNHNVTKVQVLAYLEKQKENLKSSDSIPSDCTSDAKCEGRWHKVSDSLPDNPREVLCKDEAGNYFIGRYYTGEGWDISNYDDEDKPHHLNPPVSKWIDFPSEKQKEQKPIEPRCPQFVFDDILALECAMGIAYRKGDEQELYEALRSLHSRLSDVIDIQNGLSGVI